MGNGKRGGGGKGGDGWILYTSGGTYICRQQKFN